MHAATKGKEAAPSTVNQRGGQLVRKQVGAFEISSLMENSGPVIDTRTMKKMQFGSVNRRDRNKFLGPLNVLSYKATQFCRCD